LRDDGQDRLSLSITLGDSVDTYAGVKDRVKEHEGFRLNPYILKYDDVNGKSIVEKHQTGGYGHKILPGEDIPTTQEGWEEVFETDFNNALEGSYRIFPKQNGVDYLPSTVRGIAVEMVFQLGTTGFKRFKKTIEHINEERYEDAGFELCDSKWAEQTPGRAVKLCEMLRKVRNQL
jgi:hypothetical protein